jgi:hypothetical protein
VKSQDKAKPVVALTSRIFALTSALGLTGLSVHAEVVDFSVKLTGEIVSRYNDGTFQYRVYSVGERFDTPELVFQGSTSGLSDNSHFELMDETVELSENDVYIGLGWVEQGG